MVRRSAGPGRTGPKDGIGHRRGAFGQLSDERRLPAAQQRGLPMSQLIGDDRVFQSAGLLGDQIHEPLNECVLEPQ